MREAQVPHQGLDMIMSHSDQSHNLAGPVLLLGGDGMLARAWRHVLAQRDIAYDAPDRQTLDLTRPQTISEMVEPRYSLVINCAAWTDVDGAEAHEEEAAAVNTTGVSHLAMRCAEVKATLVHYSTDYVFNGEQQTPYLVSQPRDPVNTYGRTKARGERFLQTSGCKYLLIRTSWLYAPWGRNFVRTIARLCREKDALRIVNDQHGRPTSAEHLARTSWALLEYGQRGTFHVTDGGECTWFDFAEVIVQAINPDCRVEPCDSAAFPRPARRPRYSVLDISETESLLGVMPHWKDNLHAVLQKLEPVEV